MTRATLAILVLLPLMMGGKCGGGGGGGGGPDGDAWIWAICVPNAPGCNTPKPAVSVVPLQHAIFGFYYTEAFDFPAANAVHQLHFKVHWGQPVQGAVRNGALVAAPDETFTDPITGQLVWDLLAERCQITTDLDDDENWASVHIHNLADTTGVFTPCSSPILDIIEGEVHPLYVATSIVIPEAVPGFTSENSFSEIWATDENGVFVKSPRGGLSQINVVAP